MRRATPSRFPSADGYSLLLTASFREGDVTAVRRRVAGAVRDCGLRQEAADGLVIAINEVMTNAVRHGGGGGRLRLWADGDILCEVDDRGGGFASARYVDRAERPTATADGGMGLWIAQQTTGGLSIECGSTGTTVRMVALRPSTDHH